MHNETINITRQWLAAAGARGGPVQYNAKCPCHDDNRASLSVKIDNDKVVVDCKAGCDWKEIMQAMGIYGSGYKKQDLVIKEYNYHDENGKLLYQTLRHESKRFTVRRPAGGSWVYDSKGVQRVIYRLPEFLAADQRGWVFLVEGEKDVDRLYSEGLTATCNPFGSNNWNSNYNQYFVDRNVVVIVDNDEAGRSWAKDIHGGIREKIILIKYLYLPGLKEHGDVSDWFNDGGTKDTLLGLLEQAPISPQTKDYSIASAFIAIKEHITLEEQGKIMRLPLPWPTLTAAFGGSGIPMGKIGLLVSLSGVGKSWMVYELALHTVNTEGTREPIPTFIVNTEMDKKTYIGRMLALMAGDPMVATPGSSMYMQAAIIAIHQWEEALSNMPIEITDTDDYDVKSVLELVKTKSSAYKLIIIDHLGEIDTNGQPEYAAFPKFVKALRDIARNANIIVLVVSHLRVSDGGQVDIAYSKRIQTTMDFIFALKAFDPKPIEMNERGSVGGLLVKTVNRSLLVRKNRDAYTGVEVAFNFDDQTLKMEDCGRMPKKK